MIYPIPAPGFQTISGKRKPPKHMGDSLYCQLRNGWVDEFGPWPVSTSRWIHDGTDGDIVAVKKVDERG
jgi:hypothetical protein